MFSGFPAILAWLSILFSHQMAVLIVGRVVSGFCCSLCSANCSLLVAQYSSTNRRGGFLSLYMVMSGIGVLISYTLGAALTWRYVAVFPTILYIIMITCLLVVPESPLWLLTHKTLDEAIEALSWLRVAEDVLDEINTLEEARENKNHALTVTQAIINLSRKDIRKPFILILINFLFAMFAGPFIIIFYAVTILSSSGLADEHVHIAAIAVELCMVIGGVLSIFFIQRLPRTRVAMISMTAMSLSMALLGTSLYVPEILGGQILPLVCTMVFMFSFGAGAGPLQWVFMGELLPPEYKVLAGILVSLGTIAIFITTKLFHFMEEVLHLYGVFWLLAGISALSNIFYATCMPETKGKTLLEIRKLFA